MSDLEKLDELVRAVRESSKYGSISEDLVRAIGRRELAARRGLKDAVKATKNKLHQVAGAYLDTRPRYDAWAAELAEHQEPRMEDGGWTVVTQHATRNTQHATRNTLRNVP